jgi:hypothetical protein
MPTSLLPSSPPPPLLLLTTIYPPDDISLFSKCPSAAAKWLFSLAPSISSPIVQIREREEKRESQPIGRGKSKPPSSSPRMAPSSVKKKKKEPRRKILMKSKFLVLVSKKGR